MAGAISLIEAGIKFAVSTTSLKPEMRGSCRIYIGERELPDAAVINPDVFSSHLESVRRFVETREWHNLHRIQSGC